VSRGDIYLLVSASLSLFLGALVYIFLRNTPTHFEELIAVYIDIPVYALPVGFAKQEELRLFLNSYAADALWMFSFTTGLYLLLNGSSGLDRVAKAFFYSLMFGIFSESLQYFGVVSGTFDWFDILIFIVTALFAAILCLIVQIKEQHHA
jgi:hypothetical protein